VGRDREGKYKLGNLFEGRKSGFGPLRADSGILGKNSERKYGLLRAATFERKMDFQKPGK